MRKKKKVAKPSSAENYTIFHALVEALKDKDEESESNKSLSLFGRLKLRK